MFQGRLVGLAVAVTVLVLSTSLFGCRRIVPTPGEQRAQTGDATGVQSIKKQHSPDVTPARDRGALSVEELRQRAGQPCQILLDGNHCRSEEADFDFTPDCGAHGRYAVVTNVKGADLLSKAPPQNNVIRAKLSRDQLVCVQSVAWIGAYPSYMFVTAIPSQDKSNCEACKDFGSREVQWKSIRPDAVCIQVALGRFEGG